MLTSFSDLILSFPAVVIALSFHEYAHAWLADKLGDPTPRFTGRLTINPLAHLDVLGTIMLLFFRFGWAKPVMINPANFKKPRRDMALVALSGPGINFILALFFALPFKFGFHLGWATERFFFNALIINLSLMVFNLIPLPPLDGSRIISYFLPYKLERYYREVEKYGMIILLLLIGLGIMRKIMLPIIFSILYFLI
ncbi:MAG: site-2 protease family protein [Synergistetes bacterium]|nr:site-2 protease family protein [Synergistota bacterium]MCX8128219.1 site-2 protease family protein [Synergistota bacterium]MDW8192666.1 site-2 protease family protein [Synergistota bacterium]